jgi:L-ascorbate metabolism protein UlaG (beta-lactamase superfamily)
MPEDGPRLRWLGASAFRVDYHGMAFHIDPRLEGGRAEASDLILCTNAGDMHPGALAAMLAASPRAKLVVPKSAAEHAHSLGIDFGRMTTTDSDLRVEFFRRGLYARIYAAPSSLEGYTPAGGYPSLGYLIRCGATTVYHAGACRPYEGLADRLKPYNVTVALLPIGGAMDAAGAAQLAEDIGARWLVPMGYEGDEAAGRFVDHMLGHRPAQRFKVFARGESWTAPQE